MGEVLTMGSIQRYARWSRRGTVLASTAVIPSWVLELTLHEAMVLRLSVGEGIVPAEGAAVLGGQAVACM